jgi:muramidase (phage lysozyme)
MLKTIRYAEGTSGDKGYNTRVGGEIFNDLSKKPRQKTYIKSINDYSSAEGAYQFLNNTWDAISKRLKLKDFSPQSQDEAAVGLIIQRGAMGDLLKGNFEKTINKLSPEWASLPKVGGGSVYANQGAKRLDQLSKVYYGKNTPPIQQTTTQQPTSNFINFQTPQISGNFADVPDVYREPEKETEQKPSSESLQKLKENAFLEEYQQAQEQQYAEQQQEESQPNPMMTTDVYGMAENVEKMVVGQQGGQKIIEDNSGYWNPKNQGRVVKIDGGDITMKGVNEILIGVSDKGERQIMYPNQNYQFKDAKYVTEYPTITDRERAFLNKIKNK